MKILQEDKVKNGLPAYRIILWATTKVTIEINYEKLSGTLSTVLQESFS